MTPPRSNRWGTRIRDEKLGHYYRSGLEKKIASSLSAQGVTFGYENLRLNYTVPTRVATYTPDFTLPNGIIIEAKGRFDTADRKKHLLVRGAHPDLDIRFVFSNPLARIGKASATTYAAWCKKNGFLFSKGTIPVAWLKE